MEEMLHALRLSTEQRQATDPHARLKAEWDVLSEESCDLTEIAERFPRGSKDRDEYKQRAEEAHERSFEKLVEICETPAITVHGLAAQMAMFVFLHETGDGWIDDIDVKCRDNIADSLERLAREG